MSAPPRRSGRARKPNTKYANNSWSKETLRLLRESSDSSNPTSIEFEAEAEAVLAQSDAEFDQEQLLESIHGDEGDEDGNISVASRSSRSSRVAPLKEDEEDDMSIVNSGEESRSTVQRAPQRQPASIHSRGIANMERGRSSRSDVWQAIFGPEISDLHPVLEARDIWLLNSRDVTLPSRLTIQQAMSEETARQRHGSKLQHERNDPCLDTSQQQDLSALSQQYAQARYYLRQGHDHTIVLGPFSKQNAYHMRLAAPISLGQAWKRDKSLDESPVYHSGWLLNVGEKVKSMTWAPNQNGDQYLALACRSTPQQRQSVPKTDSNTSPAFLPSAPYPISVQIWRFKKNLAKSSLDNKSPPQLTTILAYKSGDVKQMAWATKDETSVFAYDKDFIGSLATLTTDGVIRIVQITKAITSSFEPPIYVEISRPALEIISPPNSLFTCFVFTSASDLVIGSSSGYIYAYNILQSSSTADGLKPYFVHQLHQTYIMSLCLAGDSSQSEFIASASAAGTIKLTDLRSPFQDTVSVHRTRLPSRNLVANKQTRSILTSVDSSGNTEPRGNAQSTIVSHHFRHFYASTSLSKFPEGDGTSTAMAGSSLHPYILVGNTGGSVWSQNVIRRILPTGKVGSISEGGSWVQKIVEYEWIPQPLRADLHDTVTATTSFSSSTASTVEGADAGATTAKEQGDPTTDLYNGLPVRKGRSRMYHGFKPEKLDLSNLGNKKRKSAASGLDGDNAVSITFEDEQAVSAIVWNENPVAAAWCAVAWASGVIWITDLAHEAV